jgi:uncharacterized protein YkwD
MGSRWIAAPLVLWLLLSGCDVPDELEARLSESTVTPSAEREGAELARAESAVLNGINRERKKKKLPALVHDEQLAAATEAHSTDMAKGDFFGHEGSDGSGAGERVSAQGYHWSFLAENVACGQPNATEVLKSWMESKAHRDNILNAEAKHAGVSLVRRKGTRCEYFWTAVFAARE